jgi:hypothetical protein
MTKSEALECYSFTVLSKIFAILIVVWFGYLLVGTASQLGVPAWQEIGVLVLVFACLAWALGYILLAKTCVDDEYISETGLLSKKVKIADIGKCKVIDIPGLRWLIIPRVIVQLDSFGSYTFRASNNEVLVQLHHRIIEAAARAASKPMEQ